MKPILIYCYDAYCGWCYGFSPVIKRIAEEYKGKLDADVLSGGMILPEKPTHISSIAPYIQKAYKTVEATTGIKFGEAFLWHVFNYEDSDWFPNSEKSAIAMCILKEFYPEKAVEFAGDLQYALNYEGRDLTDDEAYSHLMDKYSIHPEIFYERLNSNEYRQKANYEFQLVKQLRVNGYPTVFVQINESKLYMVSRGYTEYETLGQRIESVLKEQAQHEERH
jgi:putative protein-disulfide isomerase